MSTDIVVKQVKYLENLLLTRRLAAENAVTAAEILAERLNDPDTAAKIPDYVLARLMEASVKVAAEADKAISGGRGDDKQPRNVVLMVLNTGLPPSRRDELVRAVLDRADPPLRLELEAQVREHLPADEAERLLALNGDAGAVA